jgi:hypothetical protein
VSFSCFVFFKLWSTEKRLRLLKLIICLLWESERMSVSEGTELLEIMTSSNLLSEGLQEKGP